MKHITLTPDKQKKRLAWLLLLFFLALSVPVYYLLQTVYSQLENEAYFTARHQAETLVDQIDLKLQHMLETEQNRPIAEYQFFNVMENPLLSETAGVKFSPLSEIPPKTDIKGLVGYFQINTDGSFHLPALPELGQDSISGLSLAELESRLNLKHQLRNLLSIKMTEKKRGGNKILNETLEKNKAEAVVTSSPYVEEFEQQRTTVIDDFAVPMTAMQSALKKNKSASDSFDEAYSITDGRLKQRLKRPAKKYKTRKETVQLPDQTMASSYFNRPKGKMLFSEQEQGAGFAKKDKTLAADKLSDSAINVFSFESEVTPLQLLLIGQEYFCFYRYVWHDNNRYTQGFIVKNKAFLVAMTQALISSTDFSSLLITTKGEALQKITINSSEQEYPLYERSLSMPFQKLEIIVNTATLKNVPGGMLIDLLAVTIYCLFFIGFIAFYRLGSRQIDLAKQQQNFISAVSHELKTPLTSIRMYGEMLRSGWVVDETKKQKYYDFIFFESERLSRLIANVLQLARLGYQKSNTKIITTSAQGLLSRIPPKVEAQIEASSFELNIVQPNNINEQVDIKVDVDAFFQIMINLVDNAIKFSNKSDNKQIDIGFENLKNRKQLVFFIRDYGPGIKKNQMKKVFQLFYRSGDELTRTKPGTGIGLALVAQLAETMNAKITVINKKPGAEFQIRIPVN